MKLTKIITLVLFLIFLTAVSNPVFSRTHKMGKKKAPQKTGQEIKASGLVPGFSPKAECTKIASAYGSPYRYDGSRRPKFRYSGLHGGIDLTLEPGTPLLAIASGTLVHKAKGDQMEGIYLWLLHTPQDTGKPYFTLTKYQHLNAMPELNVGDKIETGQVIALSGATGTYGGHYGAKGYPHLHLTTMQSPSGKFKIQSGKLVSKAVLFDPLALFQEEPGQTQVPIAFKDCSGQIHPAGSKLVWPVNCFPQN